MKRLTQTFEENGEKFACLPECKNGCIYGLSRLQSGCRCHNFAKILDRLSALEDILGDDYDLDRLRELVEVDRDGRVVVLPCKIGENVYSAIPAYGGVNKHQIRKFEINKEGEFACSVLMIPFSFFGKSVFFTREAAEEALKGEKKGRNKRE